MGNADYEAAKLLAELERARQPVPDTCVVAAAERQMQQWLLEHQNQAEKTGRGAGGRGAAIGPYVTISREAGVGGSQVARLLGESLGWEVLDRELVECMAERYHISPAVLEVVEETTTNWLTEILGSVFDPNYVSQQQYVIRLSRMILMAAHKGRVIFVGRGAGFLLPREQGLAVRLVAGYNYRVQQIMERRHLSREDAQKYVAKTDADRGALAKEYFHRDWSDPHLFDLVVNVEKFGPGLAAQQIAGAVSCCLKAVLSS
jgi:cytidylate kinase